MHVKFLAEFSTHKCSANVKYWGLKKGTVTFIKRSRGGMIEAKIIKMLQVRGWKLDSSCDPNLNSWKG